MKTLRELRTTPRLLITKEGSDGGAAEAYLISSKKDMPARIIFSWGGEWEHVSVSFRNRTPSWDEMCEVKRMFFHGDEVCYQLHPVEDEYVNHHPYCLHIWRPIDQIIPTPPTWMIGPRKNQTMSELRAESNAALLGKEQTI